MCRTTLDDDLLNLWVKATRGEITVDEIRGLIEEVQELREDCETDSDAIENAYQDGYDACLREQKSEQ